MKMILAVALGGALGTVARYLVGKFSLQTLGAAFPYGTLFINVSGSFIMGVMIALFAHLGNPSQEVRAFLTIGILGGYTTFSTFSLDFATLYDRGEFLSASLYVGLSVILSLLAIFAGMFLVRSITA